MSTITVRTLTGADLDQVLDDVAGLRIAVFREWPYLYEGSLDYERSYMESYRNSDRAVVVGAFDGNRLIGAATATPMADHAQDLATPMRVLADQGGPPIDRLFYGAESVLLPAYRGHGIGHRFFDLREQFARDQGFSHLAFCSVMRPDDHPLRPDDARSHDAFWRKRGYAPLPGVIAEFSWRDLGESEKSLKPLQFWMRDLGQHQAGLQDGQ